MIGLSVCVSGVGGLGIVVYGFPWTLVNLPVVVTLFNHITTKSVFGRKVHKEVSRLIPSLLLPAQQPVTTHKITDFEEGMTELPDYIGKD